MHAYYVKRPATFQTRIATTIRTVQNSRLFMSAEFNLNLPSGPSVNQREHSTVGSDGRILGQCPGRRCRWTTWRDTRDTLQMWTQIAGKICLALMPRVNHFWGIAFQVTPRGLMTPPCPTPGGPSP